MDPHRDPDDQPGAALDLFADAMRSVLRTRHDSPGGGPEAVETWSRADGYMWRWTTDEGQWRVTVGAVPDPRPLMHGPGGIWRMDTPLDEHAAGLLLVMLRVAGAIPAAAPADPGRRVMPCCFGPLDQVYAEGGGLACRGCGAAYAPPASPVNQVTLRPATAVVRGERYAVPPPAVDPPRAVLYRPSDPPPDLPAGYVAVQTTSDHPDADGLWEVVMPDGFHRHMYDPARRCLMPYETTEGEPHYLTGSRGTEFLLFEPGQPLDRVILSPAA